jgi:hypothetical protein
MEQASLQYVLIAQVFRGGARIAIGRTLLTRWGLREAGPASVGLSETLQYEVAFSGAVR